MTIISNTTNRFHTDSVEQTQQAGHNFAATITSGGVITLQGDLAAGKTTFSQGFGSFFGITRMISPTYTLIKEYTLPSNSSNLKTLYHIDLYRLSSSDEIDQLGLPELWSDPANLLLVEWPEKILGMLPPHHVEITLTALSDSQREIIITNI